MNFYTLLSKLTLLISQKKKKKSVVRSNFIFRGSKRSVQKSVFAPFLSTFKIYRFKYINLSVK